MKQYLDDGQDSLQIAHWRDRIEQDGDAVLHAFAERTDRLASTDAAGQFASALTNHTDLLRQLLQSAECFVASLPQQSGFFVKEQERRDAYAAVCRFYSRAWELFSELEQILARFGVGNACLQGLLAEGDRLFCDLTWAKSAAKLRGEFALVDRIESLAKRLYSHQEANRDLEKRISEHAAALDDFCRQRFPEISNRIGAAADVEHEGAVCDPSRVAELGSELCRRLQEQLHRR